jgi:UDP-N-acetylglucosamine 4,6-dehydratase
MVPEDDARSALELEDRYVVLPNYEQARRRLDYLAIGAKPLPEGFRYASDCNPERLDARGLQSLLGGRLSAAA